MAYGVDRFLTTHTGSLPRPDALVRTMFAKEEGVPVDADALAAQIGEAVAGVVKNRSMRASTWSTTARCRSRATPPTSRTG